MRGPQSLLVLGIAFVVSTLTLNADPIETPFRLYDHLVVVKGSINGVDDLNLIIDTGASFTVISKQLCKRLKIKTGRTSVISWGTKAQVETGRLEEVAIGKAVFGSVDTRIGDLPAFSRSKADALIGLDLLRHSDITIDYENQVLTFGLSVELAQQAPFYPNLPFLLFRLNVQGRLLTLILDTGAPHLILFEEGVQDRVEVTLTKERERIAHVAGQCTLRKVLVSGASLADTELGTLTAYLMDVPRSLYAGADGIFSPVSLPLKRLHLGFSTNKIGWEI